MIGTTISHYRITEKVGEGGMGVVYKAEDTKLKRLVALKFLRADVLEDDEHKERFLREAQAAASLIHPNVCVIHEIDESEGCPFIVMELVEGQTVKSKIKERPLKLGEALDIAIQTTQGLQAAHEKNVVHRDIKSANLMVTPQGQVKIMDFGLARLSDRTQLTKEHSRLGTPAYMSPEQVRGEKVDRRSDIWSLGVVIYEMAAGRMPFAGEVEAAVTYSILNADPEPLTALRTDVPVPLDRIVEKALAKRADERYQHVEELLVDLRGLRKQSQPVGPSAAGPSSAGPGNRAAWYVAAAASVVAVVAVAALWLSLSTGSETASDASLVPVPLTSYPGVESSPTFSPDGGRVAFHWCRDGDCDIYVKLIGSESRQQLTADPGRDLYPAWSPDGKEIAFVREISSEEATIVLVSSIGGRERTLERFRPLSAGEDRVGPYLGWHPSGKWLVSATRSGLSAISLETGQVHRLTTSPPTALGDSCPAFSPDGRDLLFCRVAVFSSIDLFRITLDPDLQPAGEPVRITRENAYLASPIWLPGEREILLSVGMRGTLAVLPMREAARPRRLGFEQNIRSLAYSGPANRLAYSVGRIDRNVWRLALASPGKANGVPAPLITATSIDHQAAYSPDDSKIAFWSNRSGNPEVWVCDADGSNAIRVTRLEGAGLSFPVWSPDGRQLMFGAAVEGNRDLYAIGVEGGKPRQVTNHPGIENRGRWSSDMETIYFSSNRTGAFECYKMPADGGEAVQLTEGGGNNCQVSADGEHLYYVSDALWRVPIKGGEATRITPNLRNSSNYTVSPEGVYFVPAQADDAGASIHFLDFASGDTHNVVEIPRQIQHGLSVTKDGKNLIWSQEDQAGADLMLVENFR